MIRIIFASGLAAAFAAGLSGCIGGAGAGQPLQGAAVGQVMGKANTVVFQQFPQSNNAIALPVTGATTSSVGDVHASATDCETVTGNLADVDTDNIAVEKISTFECTDLVSGTNTLTRKGKITVKDGDDAVAGMRGGIRVEFDIDEYNYIDTTNDNRYKAAYKGFWDYKKIDGSAIKAEADFNGRDYFKGATNNYVTDVDFGYKWIWEQTPDDPNNPFQSGSLYFNGNYTYVGKFPVGQDGNYTQGEGTFKIRYFSKDLKFDTACAKYYKSGSIFTDDFNGNQFEIRFNCTDAKFFVNGKESDLWTP